MTAIYYPDLVAWSPRRSLRFEASSPDNRAGRRPEGLSELWGGAFQKGFEFSLHDDSTGAVRWRVPQRDVAEDSPHELHVSDGGWCVVRTHGWGSAGLVTISPAGRVVQRVDLLADVFVGRWASFVQHSTAGPFWSQASHSYFVAIDGRELFCARTWWGQRVVLDLERGERVDDGPHTRRLEREEGAWALATLEATKREAPSWREAVDWDVTRSVTAALNLIAALRPDGAEPCVRPHEACPVVTYSTSCAEALGDRTSCGRRVAWTMFCHGVRAHARRALRRIGAAPGHHATYSFECEGADGQAAALLLPGPVSARGQRARAVAPGLSGHGVLRLLGSPDHVDRAWEFDLDEPPQTLRLHFESGHVDRVELDEPAWLGDARDRCLLT